jgi:hypothetical protein
VLVIAVNALSEAGAQCASSACWDLCGGCRVTGIFTATEREVLGLPIPERTLFLTWGHYAMSKEKTTSQITQAYLNLEEKDTNDLLSIWENNDREEWTDDAFEAIRMILLKRMGSLPAQREKIFDNPQ